jgi:DUF1009 family protein
MENKMQPTEKELEEVEKLLEELKQKKESTIKMANAYIEKHGFDKVSRDMVSSLLIACSNAMLGRMNEFDAITMDLGYAEFVRLITDKMKEKVDQK